MAYNLVRKGGIPALVYSTNNAASLLSCSLAIRLSEACMQATISLQLTVPLAGFDLEQRFTLFYDADNWVPGATALGPATLALPQARINEISRPGNPKLRTLSLVVKKPCPILCPPPESIVPKQGLESRFRELVDLAKAIEVYVLFDYNWVHRDNYAILNRLISHSEAFTGFHSGQHAQAWLPNWTIFSPAEETTSEAPPSYTEASNKRSRQGEFSPTRTFPKLVTKSHHVAAATTTPEPRSPKRILLSPPPFLAPSPTEKATSTSSPTSKLPTSPLGAAPDFQEAVQNAVEALLPGMLQAALTELLPRFFTTPSPTPSPTQSRTTKPRTPSFALRALINRRITTHTASHIQRLQTDALDHAAYLRSAADVDFHEELDAHKLDVAIVKDDGVAELERAVDERLEMLREGAREIVEGVEEEGERVYGEVCGKLEELVERKREGLKEEEERLEWERWRVEEKRWCIGKRQRGGRRARSVPL